MADRPNDSGGVGAEDLDIPPFLDRRAKDVSQIEATSNDRRPAKLRTKEAVGRLADKYVGKDGGAPDSSNNLAVISPHAVLVEWIKGVKRAWRKTLEGIIETGKLLISGHDAMGRHEFEATVVREFGFSPSMARKLMRIAKDERIANCATVAQLPPSWSILYELTKLPDDKFNDMLAEGSIHPGMTKLVADNAVWIEKYRKGVRVKKLGRVSPPKKPAEPAPQCVPRPEPLTPTAGEELLDAAAGLASDLDAWPPNTLTCVRLMPIEDRLKLGAISDKIVNWWLRVYDATQPGERNSQ